MATESNELKISKRQPLYGSNLWQLRAKASNRGIEHFLIVGNSKEEAEAVGRAWLATIPYPTVFISVEPAIAADPSILANGEPAGAVASDAK